MAGEAALAGGEHLVLRLHQHWKVLLRPIIVLALAVAAALALLIMVAPVQHSAAARIAVGAIALGLIIFWTGIPVLRWWSTSYELTSRRLRLRAGILSRFGRDFPLTRISDVSFSQGLLDRLLGCGRLVVESAGEHGELVLTEIPRVQAVQSLLFQLIEDEQTRLARDDRA